MESTINIICYLLLLIFSKLAIDNNLFLIKCLNKKIYWGMPKECSNLSRLGKPTPADLDDFFTFNIHCTLQQSKEAPKQELWVVVNIGLPLAL